MAVQTQVSFYNYASVATIQAYAGGVFQSGWPATNMRYPQQPFVPAKTDALGSGGFFYTRVDLGGAVPMQFIMFVNTNYSQVSLTGSNDPGFASTIWIVDPLLIGVSPWTGRQTGVLIQPSVAAARYLLIRFAASVVTAGATCFTTGGLWIGTLTPLPSDIRWDERPRIVEPHLDVGLIGGGTSRVSTGRPYVEMRARRLALTLIETPATGDDLGAWLAMDSYMRTYGQFAWYFNRGNTAEGFIVRKMNESDWNVNQVVSEDELVLHEVVGP